MISEKGVRKQTENSFDKQVKKTPQYEYACKQVQSWPEWKKEISMSGLSLSYNTQKK